MAKKVKNKDTNSSQDIGADTMSAPALAQKANLEYVGQVEIKLVKDQKIIAKKISTNHGGARLFNFLYKSLIGDSDAAKVRPNKVMLFHNSQSAPDIQNLDFTKPVLTSFCVENASGRILENQAAILHFLIPVTMINTTTDITSINQIGLYGKSITNYDDYSAVYLLANDGEWAPIDLTTIKGNYNIIVEWKMSIDNKQFI